MHGHAAERVVVDRRWAFVVAWVPLLAFDARWTVCTLGPHRRVWPRLSAPTSLTVTLLALALSGGFVGWAGPIAWTVWGTAAALWAVWLTGQLLAGASRARLVPLPPEAFGRPRSTRARATPRGLRARRAAAAARTGSSAARSAAAAQVNTWLRRGTLGAAAVRGTVRTVADWRRRRARS